MGKDAYYFSHDTNASRDPKILKLRAKHGWEGYGIFWAIIETLREQEEYKWLASDKQMLTFAFSNGEQSSIDVIDTCLEVGLLEVDEDDYIHSPSLTRRMAMKDEIIEKRRAAGKKGGSVSRKANAKQKPSKSEANSKQGKETKGNKNKESKEKYGDKVLLTKEEYSRLQERYGEELLQDYIGRINDYCVSKGTKYDDYSRTIHNWIKRDDAENKARNGKVRYIDPHDKYRDDSIEADPELLGLGLK